MVKLLTRNIDSNPKSYVVIKRLSLYWLMLSALKICLFSNL